MARPEDYDSNNPWHLHFFVMLQARCGDCGLLAKTDDLYASRLKSRKDGALERYCVLATERLQKQGWQMLDEYTFICADCWSRRNSN